MTFVRQPETGERIRRRREELGLSQREIQTPRATTAHISRIELGTREPSIAVLIEIAEPLKTTALWLMTGDLQAHCPCCGRTAGPIKDLNGGNGNVRPAA